MQKFIVLEKKVGQTPLSCAEAYRAKHPELANVPMAYAGRLDPMASGKLLVLLGEECKQQTSYHNLDKEYQFSVLLGIGSDTHDVLGRLAPTSTETEQHQDQDAAVNATGLSKQLTEICTKLTGETELPYPHFSAKTVHGKPLHTWTLEGRLDEIEIPTKTSTVYTLELTDLKTLSRSDICAQARNNIDALPPVTEARKALGNDFRRVDVRQDWENILHNDSLPENYHIAHFTCLASSGTYMRTLAHLIGQRLNPPTLSLAWSIHRSQIGVFDTKNWQWSKQYT